MQYSVILDLGGVCVYPTMGQWHLPVNYRDVLGDRADSALSPEYNALTRELSDMLDERHHVISLAVEENMVRQFYAEVGRRMRWNLTDAEIDALARSEVYDESRFTLYHDTMPFLKKWHLNTRLGILTNALPSVGKYLINSGLNAHVFASAVSTLIGAGKPMREAYAAICRRVEVFPEDCIFVDDCTENLLAAQAFRMRAIRMQREGAESDPAWTGETLHNFQELDDLLCEEFVTL